jgi:hypothetical protein
MKARTNKAIEFLLARGNLPILYWLKKDILEVPVDREYKNLKKYADRIRILKSQRPNGGWCKKRYEGPSCWEKNHYIVPTLRNTFKLYDYGCQPEMDEVQKIIEFLFSTQTKEGDFRGAYLNEYAPTYHALTLEVLCLFGMERNRKCQRAFRWLLKNHQDDGGWVIPYRTIAKSKLKKRYNFEAQLKLEPVKTDKSKPFSHLVTGMVLRTLAVSPTRRKSKVAKESGKLLLQRFFCADKYEDRHQASFWEEIIYPFWATDILSSLDSLAKIGFDPNEKRIQYALNWLINKQEKRGYWRAGFKKATLEHHLWVTLSVLRVLKKFNLLELS